MNGKTASVPAAMFIVASAFSSAFAADLPKEGTYDYTSCTTGEEHAQIEFSKAHSVKVVQWTTTNRSAIPGGFLDMTSARCVSLRATLDGKPSTTTYCELIDNDGDKILTRFVGDGTRSEATTPAGTGKYDGMVRTGKSVALGQFPVIKPGTFQRCFQQTGTYKLK